jgi:myosin heavy subunit
MVLLSIGKQFANNYFIKHRTKQDIFSVKHFAGGVEYSVQDFLEKNRDTMSQTTLNMLKLCQTKLVQDLFAEDVSSDSPVVAGSRGAGGAGGKSAAANASKQTVGGKFRGQLIGLVNNLYQTEPHFIRCVKPNHNKAAQQMDGQLTLRQLRYAGLFEAIRIRKSGYSYRANHEAFANTYQILVDDLRAMRTKKMISDSDACELILENMTREKLFPKEVWAIGTTKVFLKSNIHRTFLERRKATRVTMFVIAIQSLIRGYYVRAKYRKVRDAWVSEKSRLLNLAKKQYSAATVIQKNIRRYLVMSSLSILRDLVRLRRYVKRQDLPNIKLLVNDLEEQVQALMNTSSNTSSSPIAMATPVDRKSARRSNQILKYHVKSKVMDKSMNILTIRVFQKEIMFAKACIKLNEIQQQYLEELKHAIEQNDVVVLNRLLIKADRFDLQNHELINTGKSSLSQMNEKRDVIKQMISFLQNESDDDILNQVSSPKKPKSPKNLLEDDKSNDKDEDELFNQSSNMQALLQRARELEIDHEFIAKVERVYVSIGPRIEARTLLRRAIESVDRYGILKGIKEVESLQIHHPNFADMEVRSGNAMLRLLDFDYQLCQASTSASGHELAVEEDDEEDLLDSRSSKKKSSSLRRGDMIDESESPRLSKDLIRICDDISLLTAAVKSSSSSNNNNNSSAEYVAKLKQRLTYMKQQLKNYAKTSADLEMIIRSYKWTKLLCPWKFPEVTGKPSSRASLSKQVDLSTPSSSVKVVEKQEEEFYGLNITEARSSGYLIKLLHREIDPVIGDVPASLQASIGGPNLPYAVIHVLDEFEQVERFNQSQQQQRPKTNDSHHNTSNRSPEQLTMTNMNMNTSMKKKKDGSISSSSTISDHKANKALKQTLSVKEQLLQSR